MKLLRIKINNTIGARRVAIDLPTPIVLLCGGNGAAKSSVNESVRIAFSGDALRVTGKKDLPQLVSEGAKTGSIAVTTDEGTAGYSLPSGKHTLDGDLARGYSDALPYVLDAQRFGRLTGEERRTFLFALTNCHAAPDEIERRLVNDKDCNADKVAQVLPMVRAGFPAASEFAKLEATKAKGAWQVVTGERYGAKKGQDWTAAKPETNPAAAKAATAAVAEADKAAAAARADLDAARCGVVHHMAHFLHHHCKLLNSLELLDDTAPDSLLRAYSAEYGAVREQAPLTVDEHSQLLEIVMRSEQAVSAARVNVRGHVDRMEQALAADDVTKTAAGHFTDAAEWTAIADALAPDGIPAELLATALKPINLAMRDASLKTGWRQPTIGADMAITAEGRMYALHSVSEQWRIDAMIAAAIAELSGVKVLLLDGFDVLQLSDRDKLLLWLDGLARAGAINTALINATLKALPAGLPPSITPLWIEAGELVHEAEAG